MKYNDTRTGRTESVNLEGTPFFFSRANRFFRFGALIFLIGVWWLFIIIKKRKKIKLKEKYFKRNGGLLLQQQLTSFDGRVDKGKFFKLMILLSWPINASTESTALDCRTSCGNVPIPYPFGIGFEHCYLDVRYKVNCTSNKPFLSSINLEVLDISTETSTMVVNHSVFHSIRDEGIENVNLENKPFFFSQAKNRFIGIGCNNFAFMYSSSADEIIGGCLSVCEKSNGSTVEAMSCCGIKCCQTRIPSTLDLQVFSASTATINYEEHSQDGNKYAFLVDQDWFQKNMKSPDEVKRFEHVPVVLDWGIEDRWIDEHVENSSAWRYSSNCSTFAYGVYNNTFTNKTSSIYGVSKCKCLKGHGGNPYLFQGCQDIDECGVKNGSNPCGSNMKCINTYGSFDCVPSVLSTKSIVMIGFGTGFGALIFMIGVWWLYIIIKKRKKIKLKEKYFRRNGGLLLQQQLTSFDGSVDKGKFFDPKELDKATDHFNVNRILGHGGQGTVYKGMLTDGRIVAVKKSKVVDEAKLEEFINEVAILSQINHRNVVKLLGCCLETEVPLLVYEFIPNGTLFQYLHDRNEELPLTWEMRLQIASEVAGALSYLHSAASVPIYHRDIKSANILLDDKYRAKVADFGTSKSIAIDQTHVTTKVQGTFGYLDPEFFQSGQFTDKSDVYSFGVVLVELLTGQQAISSTRSQDNKSLATHFILSVVEDNLFDILDPEVIKLGKKEDIITVGNLAKRCLNLYGRKRPTIREVAMVLEGIQASQKQSKVQQNHEEVEYVRTDVIEPWDVVSTSTSSTFEITAPLVDTHPLLTN